MGQPKMINWLYSYSVTLIFKFSMPTNIPLRVGHAHDFGVFGTMESLNLNVNKNTYAT